MISTLRPRRPRLSSSPNPSGNLAPIKGAYYQALQAQAQSTVQGLLHSPNWLPVDSSSLGNFPWYWNNVGIFNLATWNWFNSIFQYNDQDGYLETAGDSLGTGLFNTYLQITYTLSSEDASAYNAAVNAAAGIANTVVGDYTTMFGPIPPANAATAGATMSYVSSQILSWSSTPGLTLAQLRNSLNPISLLGNAPFGAEKIITDFMSYLNATSSVATIQNAMATQNAELAQCAKNLQPAPPTQAPGWMNAAATSGTSAIVPFLTINQSTANISNGLGIGNTNGGVAFSVGMTATKLDQNTVKVSASAGAGVSGWIDWFNFSAGASASYNMFSFDQTLTSCSIKISFNNVTLCTPVLNQSAYQAATGTGWWNPSAIKQAVTNPPGSSGLHFSTKPVYNYGTNGTFGTLSNVIICPIPTFELTYSSTNINQFSQVFNQQSHFSVGFLGIPLASGSESYYTAKLTQDTTAGTITVTMSPPQQSTPVSPLDQLAYVIGAQIDWPAS